MIKDQRHPCVKELKERHSKVNVTVNDNATGSIDADICTLMNAAHLAVGAPSTFTQAFGVLPILNSMSANLHSHISEFEVRLYELILRLKEEIDHTNI